MSSMFADPEGTQIFKELLQNADDAKASELVLLLDKRTHGTATLSSPDMEHWQGPALLVFDDAEFKPDDVKSLQRPADSGKKLDFTKTGNQFHEHQQLDFFANITRTNRKIRCWIQFSVPPD